MKLAYWDCPTGLAGDMCLGALVDAGVPLAYLSEQLEKLGIADEYELTAEKVQRNGQAATKVRVNLTSTIAQAQENQALVAEGELVVDHQTHSHTHRHEHPHEHHSQAHSHPHSGHAHSTTAIASSATSSDHAPARHLPEIEHLIQAAGLPERATAWSLAIFRQLAEAEAAVHGVSPAEVHFHEVGATDAIVDVVGTCLGLDWLGVDQIYCSALPTGGGVVQTAHGLLPVPTPAVLKLFELRQVALYENGIHRELVTPTGAAIATTLAAQFGSPPAMTLQRVGLGAGSRNLPIPNIVRLWIGEGEGMVSPPVMGRSRPASHPHGTSSPTAGASSLETVVVLETQVDDLNPQAIGYLFERLFATGALDVFTQPVGMKKSRPGVLLTVICHTAIVDACEKVLFAETTTLGIRRSLQQRTILQREFHTVQTDFGPVTVKVARQFTGGPILNVQPEYEDCAQLARQQGVPWRDVHQQALQAWSVLGQGGPTGEIPGFAQIAPNLS